jgi:uncharacterized phage infection (PIP) family protein YhgE
VPVVKLYAQTMNTRELWKVNCARKLKDLEFHYSAGPTRCAVPSENLRLLKDENSDVLSTSRSSNTIVSTTSATTKATNWSRASQTGRSTIPNGSNRSDSISDSNSESVTTGKSTASSQVSDYSRRVERLEKRLASVQNERKEAQELLEATTEQLNKLEEFLKMKDL